MEEDIEKITVVVPVFNRERLVTRALDSIRMQDVRPLRIIIVDNGSKDDSFEVCRRWADRYSGTDGLLVDVIEEKRPGAARARQTGFELVNSEWVGFFDSDDEMKYGVLSAALEAGKEADIVYWPIIQLDLKEQWSRKPFSKTDQFRRHMYNGLLSTQAYIVRSDYLRRRGGWNPSAAVWNDWELGVRLLIGSPRLACLEKTGATVHSQAESITGTEFNSREGKWEAVLDMVEKEIREAPGEKPFEIWNLTRRDMLEMVDYRRVILASKYSREGASEAGKRLLESTLEKSIVDPKNKRLLKLLYYYTKLGGRGAYLLWR